MTMLTILTAGPYTSIQDKGRTGYQALGVPEGGAVKGVLYIDGSNSDTKTLVISMNNDSETLSTTLTVE